jgi:quinol-cytochrome oxidoreductase complex cytochrome b subunit
MLRPVSSLVLAVVVAVLAQFALEPWADRNDLVHWLQHGILFWSGVVAGIALVLLYRRGRQPA